MPDGPAGRCRSPLALIRSRHCGRLISRSRARGRPQADEDPGLRRWPRAGGDGQPPVHSKLQPKGRSPQRFRRAVVGWTSRKRSTRVGVGVTRWLEAARGLYLPALFSRDKRLCGRGDGIQAARVCSKGCRTRRAKDFFSGARTSRFSIKCAPVVKRTTLQRFEIQADHRLAP